MYLLTDIASVKLERKKNNFEVKIILYFSQGFVVPVSYSYEFISNYCMYTLILLLELDIKTIFQIDIQSFLMFLSYINSFVKAKQNLPK